MHKRPPAISHSSQLKLLLAWYLGGFFLQLAVEGLRNKVPLMLSGLIFCLVILALLQSTLEIRRTAEANALEPAPIFSSTPTQSRELQVDRIDALRMYVEIEAIAESYPPNTSTQALLHELAKWLQLPHQADRSLSLVQRYDPIFYCAGNESEKQTFRIVCP